MEVWAKFSGGLFDGLEVETGVSIDKVCVVTTDGKVYRYEVGRSEASDTKESDILEPTRLKDEYDKEIAACLSDY